MVSRFSVKGLPDLFWQALKLIRFSMNSGQLTLLAKFPEKIPRGSAEVLQCEFSHLNLIISV